MLLRTALLCACVAALSGCADTQNQSASPQLRSELQNLNADTADWDAAFAEQQAEFDQRIAQSAQAIADLKQRLAEAEQSGSGTEKLRALLDQQRAEAQQLQAEAKQFLTASSQELAQLQRRSDDLKRSSMKADAPTQRIPFVACADATGQLMKGFMEGGPYGKVRGVLVSPYGACLGRFHFTSHNSNDGVVTGYCTVQKGGGGYTHHFEVRLGYKHLATDTYISEGRIDDGPLTFVAGENAKAYLNWRETEQRDLTCGGEPLSNAL